MSLKIWNNTEKKVNKKCASCESWKKESVWFALEVENGKIIICSDCAKRENKKQYIKLVGE